MPPIRRLTLLVFVAVPFARAAAAQVAFLPFTDDSGYSGHWTLEMALPDWLAGQLRSTQPGLDVTSASTAASYLHDRRLADPRTAGRLDAELVRALGVRYLVTGEITTFRLERSQLGSPGIAGLQAYGATVELRYTLSDLDHPAAPPHTAQVRAASTDVAARLTLLGRPSGASQTYDDLESLPFGGDVFSKLPVGEVMERLRDRWLAQVLPLLGRSTAARPGDSTSAVKAVPSPDPSDREIQVIEGRLVQVAGPDAVFCSLGSADHLSVGERLPVYAPGDSLFDAGGTYLGRGERSVGEVLITALRGPHLSVASAVSGAALQPGWIVRKRWRPTR